MAQFFQVEVDSIQNLSEELQPSTNAFDGTQGLQYYVQAGNEPQQQFVIINNTVPAPLIATAAPFNAHLQPVYYLGSPSKTLASEMHNVPVVLNHLQQKVVMGSQSMQQQIVVSPPPPITSVTQPRARAPITTVTGIQRTQLSGAPELLNSRIRSTRPILTDPTGSPLQPRSVLARGSPMHSSGGGIGSSTKRQNGGGLVKTEDGKVIHMSEYQKFMEQKRSEKRALVNQRSPQMIQPVRSSGKPDEAPEPKRTGHIIQPNPNMRLPSVLRNFVPPPEIKDLVSRTTDNAEFENSIRMFVMLECGEQRLITFTTPKEDCTIQEILEQVGVPLEPDTYIAISEINNYGINLVVSVGFEPEFEDEACPGNKEKQGTGPLEPQSKFIPGKMAVCNHCGYVSEDFMKCVRCHVKLPIDVRSISTPDAKKKPHISINLKPNSLLAASSVNKTTGSATTSTLLNKGLRRKVTARKPIDDPIIVTLSSDDDNDDETSNEAKSNGDKPQAADKEPTIEELKSVIILPNRKSTAMACTNISCRTIRIGSYRYNPTHDVSLNSKELVLRAPHIQHPESSVSINIPRKWIFKVLVHFQKVMPMIICYLLPLGAEKIRSTLGMTRDGKGGYLDPLSSDEMERRLVLLPTSLGEEDKWVLNTIYDEPCIIEELTHAEANNILMKTSPKDSAIAFPPTPSTPGGDVKRLFIYPPGKGGIAINSEDYMCLERDQFLNDVIIDFYLKYFLNQLSHEQQSKVHVFSTFFYNRLTTKSTRVTRRNGNEPEIMLTAAQKRHLRVKNWTKNVDLFSKDFVIVPINENAHWFLAIICFPGMQGPQTMEGKATTVTQHKRVKRCASSATSMAKLEALPQLENDSDKDEAEGDESEFDIEDVEDPNASAKTEDDDVPLKQPCILIFDSLGGTSRARVVATLRDYLTCEHAAKKSITRIFTKDKIRGSCPKVPQQNNYTDCGLYVLQYVESFFEKPIDDYRIPIRGLKDWFEEIVVTRKREDITKLIRELMISYKRDVSILPSISLPTENGIATEAPPDEEMDQSEDAQLNKTMRIRSDSNTSSSTMPMGSASNSNSDNETVHVSSTSSPSRETAMSYLRAKRIIKQKPETSVDSPKKAKLEEC